MGEETAQATQGPAKIHICIYCHKPISGVLMGEGVDAEGQQRFSCGECSNRNFTRKLYDDCNAAEARNTTLLAEIDALRLALAGAEEKIASIQDFWGSPGHERERMLTALAAAEERALEKVADFWEPHWRGAGITPTADWLTSEIKAYSEVNEAKVTTLEARCAELEKFASSFHVTVVEASFYKDTYLHLVEPHSLSIRLLNDSNKSWLFADLEERRRSAIAPAPGEGEGT